MAELPLTSHDHLLASAVTVLVASRVLDARREQMWLAILRDALPQVTAAHPYVADLAHAAQRLLDAADARARVAAHLQASDAVEKWSAWRVGRAQEVIRKARATA